MRLMLGGEHNDPRLLVEVNSDYIQKSRFKFWVTNGAWEGWFCDGAIYVGNSENPAGIGVKILSDNQDRLRGDYNDGFNNWHNPDYVAPKPQYFKPTFNLNDDDIPF